MKKLLVSLVSVAALGMAGQPILAALDDNATCLCMAGNCTAINPGSCATGFMCIDIPAGTQAQALAGCASGAAWDLGTFACAPTGDSSEILITPTGGSVGRTIKWVIPGVNLPEFHEFDLRLASPTGGVQSPFDILVNYDNAGEVLVRDGTTTFDDISFVVATQQVTAVPLLGGARVALLVLGLLGAGVAWTVLRRR